MGVLLSCAQINSMLRDVTWRDVTQHFLHAVPWLIFFETFGLYGFNAQDLTVAGRFFMLDETIKKRRIHFLLKDAYDCEIFKLYSKDLNFFGLASAENLKNYF